MERFTSKDVGQGFKVCSTCKINVFILNDKHSVKNFITCKTCGTRDVVPVNVFFNIKESK